MLNVQRGNELGSFPLNTTSIGDAELAASAPRGFARVVVEPQRHRVLIGNRRVGGVHTDQVGATSHARHVVPRRLQELVSAVVQTVGTVRPVPARGVGLVRARAPALAAPAAGAAGLDRNSETRSVAGRTKAE